MALVANEASGRRLRVDPQTSPGKGEGVAAGAQRVEIGVCNANLNPMHAVYNAPHLPDRPRADSSRLGGGAPRGRFGLRAWAASVWRILGDLGLFGAAIRRSVRQSNSQNVRCGPSGPPPLAPNPQKVSSFHGGWPTVNERARLRRSWTTACSLSLQGYIYTLLPPTPLLSTSSLYYHLLSWTPSPRNVNCDSFDSNSVNAAF